MTKPAPPVRFITSNLGKVAEVSELLGMPLKPAAVAIDEIQTLDYVKLIRDKLYRAYAEFHEPVIVDDTWLSLDAYGRFPGPFVRYVLEEKGPQALCMMAIDDRRAKALTILGYYDGDRTLVATGQLEGTIAESPRGEQGFGWDSVFVPAGTGQTFAEMSSRQKNALSMRKIAADELLRQLRAA